MKGGKYDMQSKNDSLGMIKFIWELKLIFYEMSVITSIHEQAEFHHAKNCILFTLMSTLLIE